ncbi:unnamed protein product [Rhizophagus irregularis]|nr:unnamed protein product [Rhizophagus irregularis]CAB4439981.1 unnamed protein product [Rhizophagus irregularis]
MTEISESNVEFISENRVVTNSESEGVTNSESRIATNSESKVVINSENRLTTNSENRVTTNSENGTINHSENGAVTNSENGEKKLCRIRIEEETTIKLDEFNLDYPFEIFYDPGYEGDGNPSLVATIQPRNKKFQEDHRITSLSINIGNRLKNKTIFCYNDKKKEICGPYIEWPVKNYGDGYIKVQPDGNLIISATQGNRPITIDKNRALKRLRLE